MNYSGQIHLKKTYFELYNSCTIICHVSLKTASLHANREDEQIGKRMDYTDHSSDGNQISSSEEKPSSSLVLLQEQRLFRRITWLTSLWGNTIGICLILFGENCYLLAGYIPHAFYPTSPVIYRLLRAYPKTYDTMKAKTSEGANHATNAPMGSQ